MVDGLVARRQELQLLRAYIACRYMRACKTYTKLKPLKLGFVTYTSLGSFSFQKVLISLFSDQSFVSFPLSNVFRLHSFMYLNRCFPCTIFRPEEGSGNPGRNVVKKDCGWCWKRLEIKKISPNKNLSLQ